MKIFRRLSRSDRTPPTTAPTEGHEQPDSAGEGKQTGHLVRVVPEVVGEEVELVGGQEHRPELDQEAAGPGPARVRLAPRIQDEAAEHGGHTLGFLRLASYGGIGQEHHHRDLRRTGDHRGHQEEQQTRIPQEIGWLVADDSGDLRGETERPGHLSALLFRQERL
ncbi:hypothetical protein [Streptomyces sp. VNUA24]|uniref:hypothetical protein n=1 Tax=Streptomyces sp. VNUA24 TaxID=3031131 RepID=UPI0023B87950|nr:hypothetical protein [Streptomyces sp. VNUA24]WEH13074.1 hypothetical protein PYR72_04910 [Streptomyces sp. VNUA24]